MVYVKKWVDFHTQCVELCTRSPDQTRYLIKASPSQQWLILKVTDDSTCIKFRARSAIIINRFEAFTRDMTALMAGLPLPSAAAAAVSATASNSAQPMDVDGGDGAAKSVAGARNGAPGGAAQQGSLAGGTGAGGGGKKKKKKGKK